MKKFVLYLIFCVLASNVFSQNRVKVMSTRGDVRIRRGLEETWRPAGVGMDLDQIDTILTGEDGEVVLFLDGSSRFTMGGHSILDISDLRAITQRELFLYLMSQKISKIERHPENSKLRIADVNVVRAENKGSEISDTSPEIGGDRWRWETNGAAALYGNRYYTNTVLKLHKILEKYPEVSDCGLIHYTLGKAFEALDEFGKASDAYRQAVVRAESDHCGNAEAQRIASFSREAIRRLKN